MSPHGPSAQRQLRVFLRCVCGLTRSAAQHGSALRHAAAAAAAATAQGGPPAAAAEAWLPLHDWARGRRLAKGARARAKRDVQTALFSDCGD